MAGRGVGERSFGNGVGATPGAQRQVPEEVIAWVKRLNRGALPGLPEDGLTLGALETLTCAYYAEVGEGPAAEDERFWIWQCLDELVDTHPLLALDCVAVAVSQCADSPVLSCIAAGPLEDMIADHGLDVIEEIEALAKGQPRFRYVLAGVWPRGQDEGAEVWQRVLRARAAGPHMDLSDRVPDWEWR